MPYDDWKLDYPDHYDYNPDDWCEDCDRPADECRCDDIPPGEPHDFSADL